MGVSQRPLSSATAGTLPASTIPMVRRWRDAFLALHDRAKKLAASNRSVVISPPSRSRKAEGHTDFGAHQQGLALVELHHALHREAAQRQALERSLHVAKQALVQARADLTRLRSGERESRHQAHHDELTTLPNRRQLWQQLGQALTQRCPENTGPTLIYIDLDGFKAVNDAHGHCVGDEVLRITAARLQNAVRQGDLVVRLGGDEFVCLLQGVADSTPLRQLCAKLLEVVSHPMEINTLRLVVHPSIGVAICPQHGTTAKELLDSADAAMYAAKRDGSGFAFFKQCGLESAKSNVSI